MTNREWLAAMSNEEIVDWLNFHNALFVDMMCPCKSICNCESPDIDEEGNINDKKIDCFEVFEKWLGSEVK